MRSALKRHDVSELLDRYLELADSKRNRMLLTRVWQEPGLAYMGDIGIPHPGQVPIIAVPQLSMWARRMGISVAEVFTNPATYLEVFLSREIGRFTEIADDRPILRSIPIALGCGFESTLFGSRQRYSDTEDPWVDRTPLLDKLDDYEKLAIPDFYRSGLMPLSHRFYEELQEMVSGHDLEIVFPEWGRSAFGVAVQVCGVEPILVDLIDKPDLLAGLLEFINESTIHYQKERNRLTGNDPDSPYKPVHHDDDVNVPTISPAQYRDVILPVEKRYAEAFGGLMYWHSCGDTTPMLPLIREIENVAIFHVGPWTDLAGAATVFADTTLDVCLSSMDVLNADEDQQAAQIRTIVTTAREHGVDSFSIRPGILQSFKSIDEDLAMVRKWVCIARDALSDLESVTS